MIRLQRLNQDSTWKISKQGQNLLLDPWLTGTEVDGFSWFNEQWHATPPVPMEQLGTIDQIIVSQPFSDHCHEETLQLLAPEIPIAAVKAARKRLEKTFGQRRQFQTIPEFDRGFLQSGDLRFTQFRTPSFLDQVHNALLILSPDQENIFYAPHGFVPSARQQVFLQQQPIHILITTVSAYHLPFFLGGTINLGLDVLQKLAQLLQPKHIISTHDEQKHARGLVPKIARTIYPSAAEVLEKQPNYLPVDHYTVIEL